MHTHTSETKTREETETKPQWNFYCACICMTMIFSPAYLALVALYNNKEWTHNDHIQPEKDEGVYRLKESDVIIQRKLEQYESTSPTHIFSIENFMNLTIFYKQLH